MDYQEFSDRFDVLYNNITSNQAPGLTEYEKSLFLTKGQDEILKNYFNPKGNKYDEGFDGNRKRQIDFSSLIYVDETDSSGLNEPNYDPRTSSQGAVSVYLPDDPAVWFIINERVKVTRAGVTNPVLLTVKPLSMDEYDRLMSKPYKRPLKYQAWRLINSTSQPASGSIRYDSSCDIIAGPNDTITSYSIRYVKRPKPVIVGDLDGLSINGYEFGIWQASNANPQTNPPKGPAFTNGCELDEIIHEEILQRAVELAKIAWTNTGQDNMQPVLQAGQRSE